MRTHVTFTWQLNFTTRLPDFSPAFVPGVTTIGDYGLWPACNSLRALGLDMHPSYPAASRSNPGSSRPTAA